MGNIATAFNQAWRDYNTDGVSGSGNRNTPKSDARALGATIEANLGAIETYGGVATAALRRANGTSVSPTAIVLNDIIGAVDVIGYHSGGAFSTTARARMRAVATEAWTSIANGVKFVISTTPNGSVTPVDRVTIDQDGSVAFAGAVALAGALGIGADIRLTGIQYSTAPSGTVSLASATPILIHEPGGTVTALTIAFPSSPVDGQVQIMNFVSAVTTLTWTPSSGTTIAVAPGNPAANSRFGFIYRAASTKWYRII